MSVRVKLPPGCSGVDSRDGTKYTASKPGGSVVIDDRHAMEISRSRGPFLSARETWSFGTKTGRYCESCGRTWNAWNHVCPRCDAETTMMPGSSTAAAAI